MTCDVPDRFNISYIDINPACVTIFTPRVISFNISYIDIIPSA
ncbi:MAG: hypothetical protein RHS_4519 [Robinsoniella sp. RHS]|nr:MAG: hypothetical protein RHS_4519 [Robinsoniella sp. RHS]